jgi:hypothetical protein
VKLSAQAEAAMLDVFDRTFRIGQMLAHNARVEVTRFGVVVASAPLTADGSATIEVDDEPLLFHEAHLAVEGQCVPIDYPKDQPRYVGPWGSIRFDLKLRNT